MTKLEKSILTDVKQLRRDAKKLETVAKHLREQAKTLLSDLKANQRAEVARTNFYSKKSHVDPELVLTPDLK